MAERRAGSDLETEKYLNEDTTVFIQEISLNKLSVFNRTPKGHSVLRNDLLMTELLGGAENPLTVDQLTIPDLSIVPPPLVNGNKLRSFE